MVFGLFSNLSIEGFLASDDNMGKMMTNQNLHCNLCGSSKFAVIFNRNQTQILKCLKCGLVFRSPIPDFTKIQEFYNKKGLIENKYFAGLKKNYNLQNPAVKLYLKELEKLKNITGPGRALDIGCAYGVFLDLAKKYGWDPHGVEISQKSSVYARKHFKIPVFSGKVEQAKFRTGSFELVTMWDLIEHLQDPLATLKEVKRILKKDGYVLILTINIDSLIGKLSGFSPKTKDLLYDRQHNYFFSSKTLAKMLKKTGFYQIETIDTAGSQINRWQSRKIPYILQIGANVLDIVAKFTKKDYRQIVVARK